ncbi:uncharacterized protein MONOS_15590 [Monocercomonoides exilis]|uniref:uncharacterized protein n=1 Tax=Monocercomonoides exilis TaxID=2049356 RepID=UPI0035593C78|nr:hypothetical protein MONOS_15590 [Monocercomonoides exilis]|eukprot:MONOS_15590.1-p1 / transcript=MONOS_15590.1 / gene=MONOS_15590 / organism=Monocercomonoides_exilis_PA203 / gene_product=unspecified product / transcript_product=unspecified product / location=Mono_scaffold01281:3268-4500(+) / protein_length=411 / sequence_SO=supercontig / SO=protein_coding / is_pseudo=false
MDKETFESIELNVPQAIREFVAHLPEDLKKKCISLFSKFSPSLPMPAELDKFSESLGVLEKADFWKAVSQVQAQSTNAVPLPSLPTSDNICAYPAAPPNLEGVNSSVPVADEVRCDPPTNLGAAAPKNKWELSFVAPIIDEEGVPSRQFFSQLMKGEKAVKEPEKEKTPFLRSTDVQREVARKSIENDTFSSDKCLDEDQKAAITGLKRVWSTEKKRVACNKRFCLTSSSVQLFFMLMTSAGFIVLIVGLIIWGNAGTIMVAAGASFVGINLIVYCCANLTGCTRSLSEMRDLSRNEFSSELKEIMSPCVEQRVKDWRRKKEWRWLLTSEERKIEEKIDKEEEERKKNEEKEKLSREAAIEMEKMVVKQVMTAGTGGPENVEFSNQAYSASVAVEVEVESRAIQKEDEYV